MKQTCSESECRIGRRDVILGGVSVSATFLPGCGNSGGSGPGSDTTKGDTIGSSDLPVDVQSAIQEIETVFSRLSNIPIFDNDEFVFDVKYFEDEFDHLEVKQTAESAIERLEQTSTDVVSESKIEALLYSAEIGRQLVAQRVMVYQLIAAGLTLERRIAHNDYTRGLGVTQTAAKFLENLRKTIEEIEMRLSERHRPDISIEEFDSFAISNSQDYLDGVVRWSTLVYQAFHRTVLGLQKYTEGNDAMESERYRVAKSKYRDSEQQFEAATKLFDKAQVTGRRIPHLVHLADRIRCMIPAYLASSDPLQSSMDEFTKGNEESALEIARKAISSANEKSARCM